VGTEVLNAFFASVFNSQTSYSQGVQPPELEDRDGEKNKPPILQEEGVKDLLCHLNTYKSMGLDGIHPRELREVVEQMAKPLSIIYQQSWLTREVTDDWRIASVTPTYKKGRKEDPGSYRPVRLTSVPGKITECIHQACAGQPGDQAQPVWVRERQVLLDQPDLLL